MQCKQRDLSDRFLHSLKAQCGAAKILSFGMRAIACDGAFEYEGKALRGLRGRVTFAASEPGGSSTRFAIMTGVRIG